MGSFLENHNDNVNIMIFGFLLVISRFTGFFSTSPFFSRRALPRSLRLGLITALSIICAPVVMKYIEVDSSPLRLSLWLMATEFVIGLFLGVILWLPIRGIEFAGAFLDTQRGSTQAQDFEVLFQNQTTPSAIFLSQVFVGYFFSAGGFLLVISILIDSFQLWPPTGRSGFEFSQKNFQLFIHLVSAMFFSGIMIVMPISGLMFLADVIIAFLARTATTLNALTLGMPVKSAIMLVMFVFYLEILFPKIYDLYQISLDMISGIFQP